MPAEDGIKPPFHSQPSVSVRQSEVIPLCTFSTVPYLKIWSGTWNIGAKTPSIDSTEETLGFMNQQSHQLPDDYDVYVLGLQEGTGDEVYTVVEEYLHAYGVVRLPVSPQVHGRGDGSFLSTKYTGISVYISKQQVPFVSVLCAAEVSLGVTEGSKGVAGVVLMICGTTVAFCSTHMPASAFSARVRAHNVLMHQLGASLCKYYTASNMYSIDPQSSHAPNHQLLGMSGLFHHIIFMGDMNFRLQNVSCEDVVKEMLIQGQQNVTDIHKGQESARALWKLPRRIYNGCIGGKHQYSHHRNRSHRTMSAVEEVELVRSNTSNSIHENQDTEEVSRDEDDEELPGKIEPAATVSSHTRGLRRIQLHDELVKLRFFRYAFHGFSEAPMTGTFFPTYKRKEGRLVPIWVEKSGVEATYRTVYREPWYKRGKTVPRIPAFTDRILVQSADMGVTDTKDCKQTENVMDSTFHDNAAACYDLLPHLPYYNKRGFDQTERSSLSLGPARGRVWTTIRAERLAEVQMAPFRDHQSVDALPATVAAETNGLSLLESHPSVPFTESACNYSVVNDALLHSDHAPVYLTMHLPLPHLSIASFDQYVPEVYNTELKHINSSIPKKKPEIPSKTDAFKKSLLDLEMHQSPVKSKPAYHPYFPSSLVHRIDSLQQLGNISLNLRICNLTMQRLNRTNDNLVPEEAEVETAGVQFPAPYEQIAQKPLSNGVNIQDVVRVCCTCAHTTEEIVNDALCEVCGIQELFVHESTYPSHILPSVNVKSGVEVTDKYCNSTMQYVNDIKLMNVPGFYHTVHRMKTSCPYYQPFLHAVIKVKHGQTVGQATIRIPLAYFLFSEDMYSPNGPAEHSVLDTTPLGTTSKAKITKVTAEIIYEGALVTHRGYPVRVSATLETFHTLEHRRK